MFLSLKNLSLNSNFTFQAFEPSQDAIVAEPEKVDEESPMETGSEETPEPERRVQPGTDSMFQLEM